MLIQYRSVSAPARRVLERLDDVTIAPNPTLDRPIVATAWLYSMRCERLDKTALVKFVNAHAQKGPSH